MQYASLRRPEPIKVFTYTDLCLCSFGLPQINQQRCRGNIRAIERRNPLLKVRNIQGKRKTEMTHLTMSIVVRYPLFCHRRCIFGLFLTGVLEKKKNGLCHARAVSRKTAKGRYCWLVLVENRHTTHTLAVCFKTNPLSRTATKVRDLAEVATKSVIKKDTDRGVHRIPLDDHSPQASSPLPLLIHRFLLVP